MPVVAIAAAAAIVAAGTAAASTASKRSAEKKALKAQESAIKREQDINIEYEKALVSDQDKAQYIQSQKFFREQNPELAQARDLAAQQIYQDLQTGGQDEERIYNQLVAEYGEKGASDLLAEEVQKAAAEDLALGASLPADYQAELVRSGLEQAGATGVGFDRSGPVTQRLGTLLGQKGLELRQQRVQTAGQAAQLGSSIRTNRQQILQGLISAKQGMRTFENATAESAINLANANTPVIGLSGQDVMNLDLANLAARNKRLRELANIKSANAISSGNATQGHIGAVQKGQDTFLSVYGQGQGGGGFGNMMGKTGTTGATGSNTTGVDYMGNKW